MTQSQPAAVSLEGKRLLITGAASGIGAACVQLAHASGARVAALDLNTTGLEHLEARMDAPEGVFFETADLTATGHLPATVERCTAQLGGLDGLVNAAGLFQTRPMDAITPDDFDRLFDVNVKALLFVMRAAVEEMTDGGSIVNLASTAARVPRPLSAHYAATKAAVVSLTRSASVFWAPGVRVNALCPGVIHTPMIDGILSEQAAHHDTTPRDLRRQWESQNPMGRLGTPTEVAEAACWLLSDAASYITGESLGVNGGADDI